MFRIATGLTDGVPTNPPAIGNISYSGAGYHGAAKRRGWASAFGGQERAWQDYEHVRRHQAADEFQPGVDNLILSNKDGTPGV